MRFSNGSQSTLDIESENQTAPLKKIVKFLRKLKKNNPMINNTTLFRLFEVRFPNVQLTIGEAWMIDQSLGFSRGEYWRSSYKFPNEGDTVLVPCWIPGSEEMSKEEKVVVSAGVFTFSV